MQFIPWPTTGDWATPGFAVALEKDVLFMDVRSAVSGSLTPDAWELLGGTAIRATALKNKMSILLSTVVMKSPPTGRYCLEEDLLLTFLSRL
jgi:hypothetical protein